MRAFRDLIINIGEGHEQHKPSWGLAEGPEQPIGPIHMAFTLSTPIKPGYRRALTITPDFPVDVLAAGGYASVEVLQGDSQFVINPASTATAIKAWAYGDGAMGEKVARVKCDGHVGEGIIDVTIDISWKVEMPDASVLNVTEGADEPIPV